MNIEKIQRLHFLFEKSELFAERYDIPLDTYNDLLSECKELDQYLEVHPNEFGSNEDWNKLVTESKFTIICLMLKISEMMSAQK